jgi:hypothetical protein
VHESFIPYESPCEAYIRFMQVVADALGEPRLEEAGAKMAIYINIDIVSREDRA